MESNIPGVTPMVICHIGQKVDSIDGEMVVLKPDKTVMDEEGQCYRRQKPAALYTSLITSYGRPHSWIMDVCSGAGTLKFFVTIC